MSVGKEKWRRGTGRSYTGPPGDLHYQCSIAAPTSLDSSNVKRKGGTTGPGKATSFCRPSLTDACVSLSETSCLQQRRPVRSCQHDGSGRTSTGLSNQRLPVFWTKTSDTTNRTRIMDQLCIPGNYSGSNAIYTLKMHAKGLIAGSWTKRRKISSKESYSSYEPSCADSRIRGTPGRILATLLSGKQQTLSRGESYAISILYGSCIRRRVHVVYGADPLRRPSTT
mmetsp:Transcript_51786/g.108225  ORF Transcript_51786/g.108225 Transcript_51786/m.108225 type:complete len:225 (+) Transcript_51786:2330-3004(+)